MKATRDAVGVPTGVASEPGLAGGLCFDDTHFNFVKGFDVGEQVVYWAKFVVLGVIGTEMGTEVSTTGDEIIVTPGQGAAGAA